MAGTATGFASRTEYDAALLAESSDDAKTRESEAAAWREKEKKRFRFPWEKEKEPEGDIAAVMGGNLLGFLGRQLP